MARNQNEEERAGAGLPTSIVMHARNYQTEDEAVLVIPWTAATRKNTLMWKHRFASLRADAPDLRSVEVDSCFCGYDLYESGSPLDWIESPPYEDGQFWEGPLRLYSETPPTDEWDALRVRLPRMVVETTYFYWTFFQHHGVGQYETRCLNFSDETLFGPDSA